MRSSSRVQVQLATQKTELKQATAKQKELEAEAARVAKEAESVHAECVAMREQIQKHDATVKVSI